MSRSETALAFYRSSLFTLTELSSIKFKDFFHCIFLLKLHLRPPTLLSCHAQRDSAQHILVQPVQPAESFPQAEAEQ